MGPDLRAASILVILAGATSVARAQGFDPCASYPGDPGPATEILNAGLEMPVPNTGQDWIHVHGSEAHINRDRNALDLNENDTEWDFDDGLPALAAVAGIVRFAGLTTCTYGYSVVVEHTSGGETFYTHYAHLREALMVAAGQRVAQGQVLGYISGTGGYPNHLHFGLIQGTTAKYASLNGQATQDAHDRDLVLASDTRVAWYEDFLTPPAWEPAGGGGSLSVVGHVGVLAPGVTVRHQQPVFARPENGPFRVGFSAMTFRLGKAVPTGRLRIDCLADQQPSDQPILRTVHLASEWDPRSGWAARSVPLDDECPADTRFVRPVLGADGAADTAVLVDWVALEERPAVPEGGAIRFRSAGRGSVREHTWSIADAAAFSSVLVVGASTRGGSGARVVCSFPGDQPSGSCATDNLLVSYRYFWMVAVRDDGTPAILGPIGPVEPYQWAQVPGLGVTAVGALGFTSIPSWADFPYDSFDGNLDTYGFINYSRATAWVFFTPVAPVSGLTRFEAHYGTTIHRARVWAQDHGTGAWVFIGEATNIPGQWMVLSPPGVWPAVTRAVAVHLDRQDLDEAIHVAEVRFR
jgi:hypothetical protein